MGRMTALRFGEFEMAAPTIAESIRARLQATGLGILGTVRADGSPRVSPIEVSFQGVGADLGLYLGMMPESQKWRDVTRDPRCALVTSLADKYDDSGEGKLFAVARALTAPGEAATVLARAVEGTDVDPAEFGDSPVFELRVNGAAWQFVEDDTFVTMSWSSERGLRRRHRTGAAGLSEDVDPGNFES
jgi:hypothetical protein